MFLQSKIEGTSVVRYSCIQFSIQRRNLRHYRDCEDKVFELKEEVMMLKEDQLKRIQDSEKMEETILQQKEQIQNQEKKINQLEQELTEIKDKSLEYLSLKFKLSNETLHSFFKSNSSTIVTMMQYNMVYTTTTTKCIYKSLVTQPIRIAN